MMGETMTERRRPSGNYTAAGCKIPPIVPGKRPHRPRIWHGFMIVCRQRRMI